MAIDLTLLTKEAIAQLFDPPIVAAVEELLIGECGNNLPLYQAATPEGLERIRSAVLKISNGHAEKLLETISIAKRGWRDVLVWAGFADHLEAHQEWAGQLK